MCRHRQVTPHSARMLVAVPSVAPSAITGTDSTMVPRFPAPGSGPAAARLQGRRDQAGQPLSAASAGGRRRAEGAGRGGWGERPEDVRAGGWTRKLAGAAPRQPSARDPTRGGSLRWKAPERIVLSSPESHP